MKFRFTFALWTDEMGPVSGANLMDAVGTLDDPRRPSNGTRHDFRETLVISICAMLSDADSFDDIALWARLKEDWLRRFLVLKNGVPSHDTFDRVFRILDPKRFEDLFRQWVGGIVTAVGGQVAIDGKTLRGSADDGPPVHMVSAFSTDLGLALGQEKVAGKSNEITAIPVLLDVLYPVYWIGEGEGADGLHLGRVQPDADGNDLWLAIE